VKRFRRWLFSGLAVLSMLFCIWIIADWTESYSTPTEIDFSGGQRDIRFFHGMVQLVILPFPPGSANAANMDQLANAYVHPVLQLPYWLIALMAAFLPIYWLINFKRMRTLKKRINGCFCISCGYDLRATPDRCPECGKAVEKVI